MRLPKPSTRAPLPPGVNWTATHIVGLPSRWQLTLPNPRTSVFQPMGTRALSHRARSLPTPRCRTGVHKPILEWRRVYPSPMNSAHRTALLAHNNGWGRLAIWSIVHPTANRERIICLVTLPTLPAPRAVTVDPLRIVRVPPFTAVRRVPRQQWVARPAAEKLRPCRLGTKLIPRVCTRALMGTRPTPFRRQALAYCILASALVRMSLRVTSSVAWPFGRIRPFPLGTVGRATRKIVLPGGLEAECPRAQVLGLEAAFVLCFAVVCVGLALLWDCTCFCWMSRGVFVWGGFGAQVRLYTCMCACDLQTNKARALERALLLVLERALVVAATLAPLLGRGRVGASIACLTHRRPARRLHLPALL